MLLLGSLALALRDGRPATRGHVETPSDLDDEPDDPAEAARVAGGLAELAERFGVAASATADDPDAWIALLADRLRYRGPWLAADELATLRAARDAESSRVLAWDAHLRHFRDDRPLPADLAQRPLRRRLEALASSFHLDPSLAHRPPAEFPDALAHALSLPVSPRPSRLAALHPSLDAYARFLVRLPRR